MKKLALFLVFAALIALAVWYAVRMLPRRALISTGADSSAIAPSRPTPAPPMPALGPVCGSLCGKDRWLVKTLSDPDRDCVSLKPVDATVEELVTLETPAHRPQRGRVRPVECRVYRVVAFVGGWEKLERTENDGDEHVILFGRTNQRASLIAEIPNPECSGSCQSGFAERFAMARAALEAGALRPNPSDLNPVVRVTGVGFFDKRHNQKWAAPNQFELHPVLSVEFLPFGSTTLRPMSPARRHDYVGRFAGR